MSVVALDAEPISPALFAASFAACLRPDEPVIAAVSGGPDSTALLHALAGWREGGGPSPVVATVDHGLRPEGRREAEAVAAAAARLGLPHHVLVWAPAGGRISQAAARAARYRLLADLAARLGIETVATAHHRDDQAETLLLRMAAGSGLSGLAGMRPSSRRNGIRLVRPCLAFPKARLLATCRQEGWAFTLDPTNADPSYARPRWRGLAAALAGEGLDASRLARLAVRLARADEALDVAAREALDRAVRPGGDGRVVLDRAALRVLPAEIGLRVLAAALRRVPAGEGHEGPLRLDRLERCLAALVGPDDVALRPRTLSGRLLAPLPSGDVLLSPEPPRRRGRARSVTEIAAAMPHSLGTDDPGA